MPTEKTSKDTAKKKNPVTTELVRGSDRSVGESVPGSPFAIVSLSYLVILFLFSAAVIAAAYLFTN